MKINEKWLKAELKEAKVELMNLQQRLASLQREMQETQVRILGLGGRIGTLTEMLLMLKQPAEEKKP